MIASQPEHPGFHQTLRKNLAQQAVSAWKNLPAYLPLGLVLLALVLAARVADFVGNLDVRLYQCYAGTFWFGAKAFQAIPASQCQFLPLISRFHSLPLEYPPFSLAVFSLPLLGGLAGYPLWFTLMMAVTVTIMYQLLLRHGPRRAAAYFATGLLAGALATGLTRFDMAPAALSLLCLVLAERKHWTLAHVALALGVLIKIYPIVLFPILFLAEQRDQAGFLIPAWSKAGKTAAGSFSQVLRNLQGILHNWRWKNALIFAGVVIGVSAFFGALASQAAFSWLSHLYLRPFAVESTGGGLLWLASFAGIPITWNTSFGSVNILSPLANALSQGLVFLLEGAYVYILIQMGRGKMGFIQACVAVLMVLIATGKVFSPQYLLWLMPLMAISGTGNRRLWLAWIWICCLTTLIYPVFYGIITYIHSDPQTPGFMPLILLRDGSLVALTIAYLFNFLHFRDPDPQ